MFSTFVRNFLLLLLLVINLLLQKLFIQKQLCDEKAVLSLLQYLLSGFKELVYYFVLSAKCILGIGTHYNFNFNICCLYRAYRNLLKTAIIIAFMPELCYVAMLRFVQNKQSTKFGLGPNVAQALRAWVFGRYRCIVISSLGNFATKKTDIV